MKSINFTKENLESLKSMGFIGLNKDILFYLIDLIGTINFQNIDIVNSIIEIRNDGNNDSVCFTLNSKKCIPIEIVLHKNYIDMTVSNYQSIREMYKINKDTINDELKFLFSWFNYNIINKVKYSGKLIVDSKFYNEQNIAEIIFKSTSLLSFLSLGNKEEVEYKSWK